MAAPVTLELDSAAFRTALSRYADYSTRDRAEIVNRKARDAMFKAASHTDIKKEGDAVRKAAINYLLGRWAFRNWLVNRNRKPGKQTRIMDMQSARMIKRRVSAVGYVRHGFVLAGNQFKRNQALTLAPSPVQSISSKRAFRGIRSQTQSARPGLAPVATFQISWNSAGASDFGDRAVSWALKYMVRDMTAYADDKMVQRGRKVGLAVRRALT